MDCPKCGTWNPDDKRVCWRCQEEMPRPVEKKPKTRTAFLGLPPWTWVVLGLLLVGSLLIQCLGPTLGGG